MTTAPSVDVLVDATPDSRDRTVDLLRAASIGVVVVWHWVLSVTHRTGGGALTMPNPVGDVHLLWLLTWVLQVMPLFFIVGGFANLASWHATERAGGGWPAFARRRLERLLRPVAMFVAVWAGIEVVGHTFIPGWPSVLRTSFVVFVPLWFLGVYAAVTLLTPLTARLHERSGVLVPVALGAALVVSDLGRFRFGAGWCGVVTTALVWVFCHQLGYLWRDGRLVTAGRGAAWSLVVGGLTALVVLTNIGPYPRSMVAVRGEAISNMLPTTACIGALGVLQLGLVILLRDRLTAFAARRRVWRTVIAANGIAMTVFVWHMTALVAVITAFEHVGGTLRAQPTAAWWLQRPMWLLAPAIVLAALVRMFARMETGRQAR